MPRDDLAERVVETEEKLRQERAVLEATWSTIAHYMLPRKATFQEEVATGVQRNRHVLDSTAPRSLEMFASFLHTLLNNPSKQWFELGTSLPQRLRRTEHKQVLEENQRRVLDEMVSPRGNLYSNIHECYLDVGAFGTSIMFVGEIDGRVHFKNVHLGSTVLTEDADGFVDGAFYKFKLTPRQAIKRWPEAAAEDRLGASVKAGSDGGDVEFVHAVVRVDEPDFEDLLPDEIRRGPNPYASLWVNKSDRVVVASGTFEEFPYVVARWYKVRDDLYGRSPGMTVLPDVRMVNRMAETILRGAEKLVDPPILIPEGGLVSPVRLFSGGVTFSDGQVKPETLLPPGASRIEVGDALLKERQQAIREGFFVPLFVTPDSPVKTATQVLQEVDERNRAVSPMLIRMQTELFQKLIRRVYNIMDRQGRLAELPPDLAAEDVQVEYKSPLQASQKQVEALGVTRILEALLPWGQIDPGVFDRFDPDEVAATVHAGSGAPDEVLRTRERAREVRQARQQQAEQQEQFDRLIQSVEAGAKMSQATGGQERGPR